MSSKVLEVFPEDEIQALPWLQNGLRNGLQNGLREAPAPRKTPRGEDAARLQNQLDELAVNLEKQTRAAAEKGFRDGEAAARQKLEVEFRATVAKLAEAIAQASEGRAEAIRRAESDTVRLAIEIARRVVHRELSVDPGALEGLIKAALEKLINHEVIRVRVHPALEKMLLECMARNVRGKSVEVVADSSQAPGGVIFEIARGSLDASVDTQLREIERGLLDEMRNRT